MPETPDGLACVLPGAAALVKGLQFHPETSGFDPGGALGRGSIGAAVEFSPKPQPMEFINTARNGLLLTILAIAKKSF